MKTTPFIAAFALLILASCASCSGGSDDDPLGFSPCDVVACEEGQFCDDDTGACRCDAASCGEGALCVDDTRCEDAPELLCGWGHLFVDGACTCDAETCDGADGWSCDGDRCLPDDASTTCVAGDGWAGDEPAFRDLSDAAGLAAMNVVGTRIATADLTGNGAPDLLIRRAGHHRDGEDDERHVWLLENQGDRTFQDITHASGLLQRRGSGTTGRPVEVVAFADVNNNGHLDIVTLFSRSGDDDPDEGAEVLLNQGDKTFALSPLSEPLHGAGQTTGRSGAAFLDVDRDGQIDLFIGQTGAQDLLLKGDGTGRFEDITADAGVTTQAFGSTEDRNQAQTHGHSWAVAACDLDGDGTPELLSANYGRAPNHLFLATDGTYENHSVDSGYSYDHRMDWTDNESARCFCQLNREAEDCADVPPPAFIRCDGPGDVLRWNHATDREPYRLGGNSGSTVCADLNNNGRLDLLTTEIVHWDVGQSSDPSEILYNTGEEPLRFDRPGNDATGLTRDRTSVTWDDGDITAAAFDFDNDGRLDILIASTDYPGTRALLYHQQHDGTFELVPLDLGIDHTSAHGVAVADFTGNGALDVAIGHSRMRCGSGDHCLDEPHVRLFENLAGAHNNWLQVHLEGADGTNRAAIGAHVTVYADGLHRTAEVGGGHGHYGIQHDLVQHFGLGSACEATIVVRWPDQDLTTETYRLPAGTRFHLRQGEAPRPLP